MRHFYYLKTPTEEIVYQDEEIVATPEEKEALAEKIASKEVVVLTKGELQAELEKHKLAFYDAKIDTTVQVDAKDATCLIRWDGTSPYYELIKGTAPTVIPFLGWDRLVDKDSYVEPVEDLIT